MDLWIAILMPWMLLLARTGAFFVAAPVFSAPAAPAMVRAGLILVMTVFFGFVTPPTAPYAVGMPYAAAGLMLVIELLLGLAIGLAARLVYLGVQVGGRAAAVTMGLAEAGIFDPTSGERGQSIALYLEMVFIVLFLAAGGHHLLIAALESSYRIFPAGEAPDPGRLLGGIVDAGSTMLLFGLKLAAPVLAAFLLLSVVLGVLARVLPEMNILLMSFPLRVGLGLFMAAKIIPLLNDFAQGLANWMNRTLIV